MTTVANEEFYKKFDYRFDQIMPECNPLESKREGCCRHIFKFSKCSIETPQLDMYGNPFLANDIAILKAEDGTYIRMEFGELQPVNDSLPDRYEIKRIIANANDVTKAFVNPRQPWVRGDHVATLLHKLHNIHQNLYKRLPYII